MLNIISYAKIFLIIIFIAASIFLFFNKDFNSFIQISVKNLAFLLIAILLLSVFKEHLIFKYIVEPKLLDNGFAKTKISNFNDIDNIEFNWAYSNNELTISKIKIKNLIERKNYDKEETVLNGLMFSVKNTTNIKTSFISKAHKIQNQINFSNNNLEKLSSIQAKLEELEKYLDLKISLIINEDITLLISPTTLFQKDTLKLINDFNSFINTIKNS